MAKTGKPESETEESAASDSALVQTIDTATKSSKLQVDHHSTMFQLKLLLLFSLKGIEAKYQFTTRTETENIGGMFDDFIFRYKNETSKEHGWRYRYLQVENKQSQSLFRITANQLLADDGGYFSLPRCFRSFREDKKWKEVDITDIEDIIICTNVDFDNILEDLKKNEIDIEKMEKKKIFGQCCYKIKPTGKAINSIKTLNKSGNDSVTDEEIEEFLKIPIFVVIMPDRAILSKTLANEIRKHYPHVQESDLQSSYILNKILKSFKENDSNWYSSISNVKEISRVLIEQGSLRATTLSIDYQAHLNEVIQFSEQAVTAMAKKLKSVFGSSNSKTKLTHITTSSPTFTAAKVIMALKHKIVSELDTFDFECDGSYLVTSSSRLQQGCGKRWMKNWLLHEGNPQQQLLIIVCDDIEIQIIEPSNGVQEGGRERKNFLFDQQEKELLEMKNVIVIENECCGHHRLNCSIKLQDAVTYGHLNDDSKKILLSKRVIFQGNDTTVGKLFVLEDNINFIEPMDFRLIFEELTMKDKPVIPSLSNVQFKQQFYTKRKMSFPFSNQQDLDEIAKDVFKYDLEKLCTINADGSIKWKFENQDVNIMWEAMKKNINKMERRTVECSKLMDSKFVGRLVIICGEAGTGKSTMLSHFYEDIKQNTPNNWVIRINLKDHVSSLSEFNNVISFFTESSLVVNDSLFAQKLLTHRLTIKPRQINDLSHEESGVVVMLDGFNEIDCQYRENAIKLMIAILNETYVDRLYVTTRNDFIDELQDRLFQFAHILEHPTKEDQINYLIMFWKKNEKPEKTTGLQELRENMINGLTKYLNDTDMCVFTPMLQCRILFELFKYFMDDEADSDKLKRLLSEKKNFRLANLYKELMERKREAFCTEKKNSMNHVRNQGRVDLDVKITWINTKAYLTRLAIEAVFPDKATVNLLWPPQSSLDSRATREEKEETDMRNALDFGLIAIEEEKNRVYFLHQTFAEYLVAEYLYQGFHLDEKQRNRLLERESVVHQLIAKEILVKDEYKGVRVFLNSMLGENEKNICRNQLPESLKKFTDEYWWPVYIERTFNSTLIRQNTNLNAMLKIANTETELFLDPVNSANFDFLCATALSIDYQEELNNVLSFNEEEVSKIAKKLALLLCPSVSEELQVMYITTPSPRLTVVKVITALKHPLISKNNTREFQQNGSYLVTSSTRLQKIHERKVVKKAFLTKESPPKLLIVVADDDSLHQIVEYGDNKADSGEALFTQLSQDETNLLKGKQVIVIGKEISSATSSMDDTITYDQLSDSTQEALLSRKVSFQRMPFNDSTAAETKANKDLTVGDLIGYHGYYNDILDLQSMEELLSKPHNVVEIPSSFRSPCIERQHYINRRLVPMEWGAHGSLWIEEKDFIHYHNSPGQLAIISGVAGSGKSTFLSHMYEAIKEQEKNSWVILLNLPDHQKELSRIDETVSSFSDFLVNLPVVVGNSQFARSLLKHRLKNGDRIALMLDGFDKIDRQCQEKTIQLINSRNKLHLYLTTRRQRVDELENRLGRGYYYQDFGLVYYLNDFGQEDQIKYLISFWRANLKAESDEKDDDEYVKHVAKSLVDRVTSTLKDKESFFMGVPLHCRILAECFLLHFTDHISNPNQPGESTSERTDEKLISQPIMEKLLANFRLVNFFRLLMDKERETFRQEKVKEHKAKTYCLDQYVEQAVAIKLEKDLIRMAIEMIVSNGDNVEVLLGRQGKTSFQSDTELEEEVQHIRDDNGILFGLLDERRDDEDGAATIEKEKVKFLQRTYAEYLVADYLYKGFLLDDDKRNKLLENKSIRHFIVSSILAEIEQYNGVQVFLNLMLEELLDNDKWRDHINRRKLPDRYRQFAKNLLTLQDETQVADFKTKNALYSSVQRRKNKMFHFLCDCLDATYERQQIQNAMCSSLVCDVSLGYFCEPNEHGNVSAEVFRRFLNYVGKEVPKLSSELVEQQQDIPNKDQQPNETKPCSTEEVMKSLLNDTWDYKEDYWNGEEQKQIVGYLLRFFENNPYSFNQTVKGDLTNILCLFIWNENYHDHLQTYLRLLSETELCLEDDAFAKVITRSIVSDEILRDGRIDKTLSFLCTDLNRPNVQKIISRDILKSKPQLFQQFYIRRLQQLQSNEPMKSIRSITEENVRDWLHWLLDKDEGEMTRLQQVTFRNEKEKVKEILDIVAEVLMPSEKEMQVSADVKGLAQQAVDLFEAKEDVSPLHVAIKYKYEEIVDMMLSFLIRVLDKDKLEKRWMDENGLLYRTLQEAIKIENVARVKLILESVKGRLGQVFLLNLLKSKSPDLNKFLIGLCSRKVFDTVVGIIVNSKDCVSKPNIKDYKDLNDLIYHDKNAALELMKNLKVDTLRGLMSVNGIDDWTRRILDTDIDIGFDWFLSAQFRESLTGNELSQILDTITLKSEDKTCSYWESYDVCCRYDKELLTSFFQFISFQRDIDSNFWIKRLVVSSKNNTIDRKGEESIRRLQFLIDATFDAHFPQELLDEVTENVKKRAPQMIQDTFFSPTTSNLILNWFPFYLEYGSDEQLKDFVNVATKKQKGVALWDLYAEYLPKMVPVLKRVSEKAEICGRDAVKKLLIHGVKGIPFVMTFILKGIDVFVHILNHLPKENQEEMKDYFRHNYSVPKLMDLVYLPSNTKVYYGETRLNLLQFFLHYADENQRKHFIENITTRKPTNDTKSDKQDPSMWNLIFTGIIKISSSEASIMIDRFMECVKEKLGQQAVMQLALHDEGEGAIINILKERGNDGMVKAMIACLDDDNRQRILAQSLKKTDDAAK